MQSRVQRVSEKSENLKNLKTKRGDSLRTKNISIESDGDKVSLWVDGERVDDVIEIDFHASADIKENWIRCSYWKNTRNYSGRLLVLNNEIITEKVIVSE